MEKFKANSKIHETRTLARTNRIPAATWSHAANAFEHVISKLLQFYGVNPRAKTLGCGQGWRSKMSGDALSLFFSSQLHPISGQQFSMIISWLLRWFQFHLCCSNKFPEQYPFASASCAAAWAWRFEAELSIYIHIYIYIYTYLWLYIRLHVQSRGGAEAGLPVLKTLSCLWGITMVARNFQASPCRHATQANGRRPVSARVWGRFMLARCWAIISDIMLYWGDLLTLFHRSSWKRMKVETLILSLLSHAIQVGLNISTTRPGQTLVFGQWWQCLAREDCAVASNDSLSTSYVVDHYAWPGHLPWATGFRWWTRTCQGSHQTLDFQVLVSVWPGYLSLRKGFFRWGFEEMNQGGHGRGQEGPPMGWWKGLIGEGLYRCFPWLWD